MIEQVLFRFFESIHESFLQGSASTKDDNSEESRIWKHEISPLIETLIIAYES